MQHTFSSKEGLSEVINQDSGRGEISIQVTDEQNKRIQDADQIFNTLISLSSEDLNSSDPYIITLREQLVSLLSADQLSTVKKGDEARAESFFLRRFDIQMKGNSFKEMMIKGCLIDDIIRQLGGKVVYSSQYIGTKCDDETLLLNHEYVFERSGDVNLNNPSKVTDSNIDEQIRGKVNFFDAKTGILAIKPDEDTSPQSHDNIFKGSSNIDRDTPLDEKDKGLILRILEDHTFPYSLIKERIENLLNINLLYDDCISIVNSYIKDHSAERFFNISSLDTSSLEFKISLLDRMIEERLDWSGEYPTVGEKERAEGDFISSRIIGRILLTLRKRLEENG